MERAVKFAIRLRAFSLLELLIVVAIIGVLAVMVAPAFNSLAGTYTVTQQGQLIGDQINLTRQFAVTRNREVELRLIPYPGRNGDTNWAVQIWETTRPAETPVALSRLIRLADTVMILPGSGFSPLLDALDSENGNIPPLGEQTYHALRFRSNGRVAGGLPAQRDYLTLTLRRDKPDAPANPFTLQVHPMTGRVSIHRP